MSPVIMDVYSNGNVKNLETASNIVQIDDSDFLRLLDRPRPISIERNRSFEEKSFNELSSTLSPLLFHRNVEKNSFHIFDLLDHTFSPVRSSLNTPRSNHCFEPHPVFTDAWEALRRSLVYFRGQPVGTIAAIDHSSDELNYDQVCCPVGLPISPFNS